MLNGRLGTTRVSAKTVQAIEAQAKRLNYRRNASASALATGRQNVLGLFIHRVGVAGSGIVDAMIHGVSAEAAVHHKRLLIHFFETMNEFLELRDSLQRSVMDGLIVGGLYHKEMAEILNDVSSNGLPVITLLEGQFDKRISNVGMRQTEIGRKATSHLIARGCNRIAHFRRVDARFEGYRAALNEAGLRFDPDLAVQVKDYEHTTGSEAVEDLLQRGIEFDGIFAASDQLAVGAMHALVGRGQQIPQDVKIIGVDNSPFCEFTYVPLSSVSQSEYERGRMALRMLVEQAESIEPVQPQAIWFEPVLLERESTRLIDVI